MSDLNLDDILHQTLSAPDFDDDLDWINTSRSVRLRDVRGKIVLLDFWTYG